MNEKQLNEIISELMATCGFGNVILPITPVSGGFLHRMYKVKTDCGMYAVKYLNPEIMSRAGVHDSYKRAEEIEQILEKEGIPIIPSITVNGKKMQAVQGHYFYIFNWQEGHITDWNNISNRECNIAGNILGKIHAINPKNDSHKEAELSEINWQQHIRKAKEEKSEIAVMLAENEPLFIYAENELNKARNSLPDIMCVTNEDMDPKNIMWDNGEPRVIDLECLDYGNPISGALQLALQWSGITTCNLDIEKLVSFFDGYLEAYDNHFRGYSSVFGLAYTWLEWLEHNIKRALGESIDDAEKEMGISEVKSTIARIKYIRSIEKEIKDTLDSRL